LTPGKASRRFSSTTSRGRLPEQVLDTTSPSASRERNELLPSYTHRFFDVRSTIANISEEDIIDCFYNGLTDPGIYRDFGHNRPKTVAGLCDMMHDWSEQ
jgi:hypothetical protein